MKTYSNGKLHTSDSDVEQTNFKQFSFLFEVDLSCFAHAHTVVHPSLILLTSHS